MVVPNGVLFGSSIARKDTRRILLQDHVLEAVIRLPSGVFRPLAGVSFTIVVFAKTGVGDTDRVWFWDMAVDSHPLDDKHTPLLDWAKVGVTPAEGLANTAFFVGVSRTRPI